MTSLTFSASGYLTSRSDLISAAQSCLVRCSVTEARLQPVRGSTNMNNSATPFRTYSSS